MASSCFCSLAFLSGMENKCMDNVGPPCIQAKALGLPSGFPWISVSPAVGTRAFEPLRLQPHSRCWYSGLHVSTHRHTHTSGSQSASRHHGLPSCWLGSSCPSSSHLLQVPHPARDTCPPTPLAHRPLHLLTRLDLWDCSHTRLHIHTHSRCCNMDTALQPMVSLHLLHSDPHTHTCTENRVLHPGKALEIEFNEQTGQTALVRHRAQSHEHKDQPQFTCN